MRYPLYWCISIQKQALGFAGDGRGQEGSSQESKANQRS